jgi:hypothetical protein
VGKNGRIFRLSFGGWAKWEESDRPKKFATLISCRDKYNLLRKVEKKYKQKNI